MVCNRILKEAIQSVLALLGMCLVVYIFIYIDEKDTNEILQNGVETIGDMSPRLARVIVSYRIDAKEYSNYHNSPFPTIEEGEKYIIIVDKRNPNNILIEFDKPVILGNDINCFRKTKMQSIEKLFFEFDGKVKFTYSVKGKFYNRFQRISKDQEIDFSQNTIYEVIYDIRNPQIAYLILPDIPICY